MPLGNRTLRVHGLDQLSRDFGKLNKGLQRQLQAEIRRLAEPAAEEIRQEARERGFSDATISGIRPGSRRGVALVVQRRRKTSGTRPDFGGIQYRLAFIPGAEKAAPFVLAETEHWLHRITSEHGLSTGGTL